MAQDREDQPGKTPVSAHPAFPAIVGLWFAALLGLGTIVMPAIVLEQIASATGLAGVFPPAEAPLSAAGRAVFALIATVLGLVGGLALARRVAHAHDTARPARRRTANGRAAPPRPLSVHEDLGEDAIAAPATASPVPGAIPGRRRALAVTDEAHPSDFLMAAPLPGETHVPELLEDPMSERPSEFEPPHLDEVQDELSLEALAAPADAQVFETNAAPAEETAIPAYVPELDTRKPRAVTAPPAPEPEPEIAVEPEAGPIDPFTAPVTDAPIDKPLEDLGMVQLAERLGRSLQQRLIAREAEVEAQAEAVAVPPPVVPDALRAFMDGPPEDFAPSLPAAAVEPAGEVQVAVPPPVVPSALMPFAFEQFGPEDDDDELDPGPFTLPLSTMVPRPFDVPVVSQAAPVESVDAEDGVEDEDDAGLDENYSSLLEMKNPFRPREEFVRVDEPEAEDGEVEPAVVFPGQATAPQSVEDEPFEPEEDPAIVPAAARPFDAPHQPAPSTAPTRARPVADAAETERALRAALANLQRMSGAA